MSKFTHSYINGKAFHTRCNRSSHQYHTHITAISSILGFCISKLPSLCLRVFLFVCFLISLCSQWKICMGYTFLASDWLDSQQPTTEAIQPLFWDQVRIYGAHSQADFSVKNFLVTVIRNYLFSQFINAMLLVKGHNLAYIHFLDLKWLTTLSVYYVF